MCIALAIVLPHKYAHDLPEPDGAITTDQIIGRSGCDTRGPTSTVTPGPRHADARLSMGPITIVQLVPHIVLTCCSTELRRLPKKGCAGCTDACAAAKLVGICSDKCNWASSSCRSWTSCRNLLCGSGMAAAAAERDA